MQNCFILFKERVGPQLNLSDGIVSLRVKEYKNEIENKLVFTNSIPIRFSKSERLGLAAVARAHSNHPKHLTK